MAIHETSRGESCDIQSPSQARSSSQLVLLTAANTTPSSKSTKSVRGALSSNKALFAYFKSLPPIRNAVPPPKVSTEALDKLGHSYDMLLRAGPP